MATMYICHIRNCTRDKWGRTYKRTWKMQSNLRTSQPCAVINTNTLWWSRSNGLVGCWRFKFLRHCSFHSCQICCQNLICDLENKLQSYYTCFLWPHPYYPICIQSTFILLCWHYAWCFCVQLCSKLCIIYTGLRSCSYQKPQYVTSA